MQRLLLLLALLLLFNRQITEASPPHRPHEAINDWRFGLIETYEAPAEATSAGAAWTRVRFHWAEVQAGGPGSWTPGISEAQINGEVSAGRLVVGLLIGIPDWARDGKRLPTGLARAHDDPGNSWANYVRQAVTRYNGRINHWIIWNEPDIGDPAAPGHTWDGTVEEFFQLQRTAYLVAKEANPNATIHLSAFTHFWDPGYFNHFLDVVLADPAAPANNYYFDVATAHLYFQPNSIYDIIQAFYGAMAGHGISKPIWLVETNAPPLDDPAWPVPNWTLSVTQNEQAAFIPQALASALAAGAQRIAIYKLKDTPDDRAANPEPFGLVRMDGSRRPAFTTYQVATRYLAGMTGARRERWNEVGQIRISQEGQSTTVLFARLPIPQQAQVPATADTARLVDMWGSERTINATGGFFHVELPPALCSQPIGDYCMIGGTTFYLVQASDSDPPAAIETVPAAPSAVITATTSPEPTATVTATLTSTPSPTPTSSPAPSSTATPTLTATATAAPPTATATPQAAATAATTPRSTPTPPLAPPASSSPGPGIWLAGVAVLLVIGLGMWWWNGRR